MGVRNSEDLLLKSICTEYPDLILDNLGISHKFVSVLPTETITISTNSQFMDFVFETDDDLLVNLESQSTNLSKKDLKRFASYQLALNKKFKKQIKTYIICSFSISKIPKDHKILPQLEFYPIILSFKDLDGDEKLNNLESKLKNKEEIPKDKIIELALVPLMNTKNTTEEQVKKIVKLFPNLKINDEKIETHISEFLSLILDKFIKNKKEQEELWEAITMYADFVYTYNEKKEKIAEEKGIIIGEERGKEKGIKIGEEQGKEKGIKIGEEQGKEKGIKIGKENTILEVAKTLIKENIPLEIIIKTTKLSKEKIESLK